MAHFKNDNEMFFQNTTKSHQILGLLLRNLSPIPFKGQIWSHCRPPLPRAIIKVPPFSPIELTHVSFRQIADLLSMHFYQSLDIFNDREPDYVVAFVVVAVDIRVALYRYLVQLDDIDNWDQYCKMRLFTL